MYLKELLIKSNFV